MHSQENNPNLILRRSLQRLIAPTYDELTLFVISFTCVLFFASNFKSAFGQGNLSPSVNGAGPVLLSLIIIGGIAPLLLSCIFETQENPHRETGDVHLRGLHQRLQRHLGGDVHA